MQEYKLIGRGEYTKCYRKGLSKYVYLKSVCQVKECMALGWHTASPILPKITYSSGGSDPEEYDYKMKYYQNRGRNFRISSLTPYYRTMYRELRKLHKDTRGKEFFEKIMDIKTIKLKDREAIWDLMYTMRNWVELSEVFFEISPRNVAEHCGRLILLDCVFIREKKRR
ncbi:hypothetical protein JHD46_05440 [Sulfurimonas sp. SAG-AH-194-C20]|nr:hypothetical protein [Sulfurimonas sp. SAG-AH-194-C20]MDF1879083.1 hypothetical protein [Sulfurimonas sp. SAG-AH-194-C20]